MSVNYILVGKSEHKLVNFSQVIVTLKEAISVSVDRLCRTFWDTSGYESQLGRFSWTPEILVYFSAVIEVNLLKFRLFGPGWDTRRPRPKRGNIGIHPTSVLEGYLLVDTMDSTLQHDIIVGLRSLHLYDAAFSRCSLIQMAEMLQMRVKTWFRENGRCAID